MVKNYYKHIGLCLLTLLGTCNNAFGMSFLRMVASRMPRFAQFQTPRFQSLALTRHVTNPTLNRAFRAPALTGIPRTFTAPCLSSGPLATTAYRPTALASYFSTDSKNDYDSQKNSHNNFKEEIDGVRLSPQEIASQKPSLVTRLLAFLGIGGAAYLAYYQLSKIVVKAPEPEIIYQKRREKALNRVARYARYVNDTDTRDKSSDLYRHIN